MKKGIIIATLVILAINGVRIASRLSTTSSTAPELPPASVSAALDAIKQHNLDEQQNNFNAKREASALFKYPTVCQMVRKGDRLGNPAKTYAESILRNITRNRGGYTRSQEDEIVDAVYDRCLA